jgi:hypothetical protein
MFAKKRISSARKTRAILLAAAMGVVAPVGVRQLFADNWIGTSGGFWTDGTQWSPAASPSDGDPVSITTAFSGTQTIVYDYSGSPIAFSSLTISASGGGTNVLLMSSNALTVSSSEYIGDSGQGAGGLGVISQSGGTHAVAGPGATLFMGYNATDTGTYLLAGGTLTGNLEYIGYGGTGIFNQSNGTNSASSMNVSVQSGSTGSYVLSGGQLTSIGAESIGFYGDGNFNQSGGSNTLTAASATLYVGAGVGGTGTYSLSGGSLNGAATEFVGYSLGSGTFNQSGGTNALSGASGTLNVSNSSGATGTYSLSAGALNATSVSVNTAGSFNWTGGTVGTSAFTLHGGAINAASLPTPFNLTWSTGTLNITSSSFTVGSGGPLGTSLMLGSGQTLQVSNSSYALYVDGGGSLAVSNGASVATSGVEFVGYNSTGTFNQYGGTNSLGNNGGALILAGNVNSTGTYVLSAGILSGAFSEYVGADGTGTFNQSGGTNSFGGTRAVLHIGYYGGSSGTYTLSGGILSNANSETLGNFGGSNGTFNQSGGTNSLRSGGSLLLGQGPGETGTYSLSGGALTATSINVGGIGTGTFIVSNWGSFSVSGTLTIFGTGAATVTGSIASHAYDSVGSLQIAAGGLLTLDNSALTINYGTTPTPNATIRGYISSAYNINGTLWSGTTGITSTNAAADPAHHSIAFADGADGVVTNLPAGISTAIPNGGALPAGREVITYAYAGDANLDGKVDFNDFVAITTHFMQPDINWDHGNFNYDGIVDFNDFIILSTNFGEGVTGGDGVGATPQELAQFNALAESYGISSSQIAAWNASISNLPEPGSLGFILLGALLLRRRCRANLRLNCYDAHFASQ